MTDMDAQTEHPVHHEVSDVNVRAIFQFAIGLAAVAIACSIVVALLFRALSSTASSTLEFPMAAGQQNQLPPEPRLQTTPREDMSALRAREDALLSTYGWVDRTAGVVRIPIAEAMRLTVERGLPTRQPAGATP